MKIDIREHPTDARRITIRVDDPMTRESAFYSLRRDVAERIRAALNRESLAYCAALVSREL